MNRLFHLIRFWAILSTYIALFLFVLSLWR